MTGSATGIGPDVMSVMQARSLQARARVADAYLDQARLGAVPVDVLAAMAQESARRLTRVDEALARVTTPAAATTGTEPASGTVAATTTVIGTVVDTVVDKPVDTMVSEPSTGEPSRWTRFRSDPVVTETARVIVVVGVTLLVWGTPALIARMVSHGG
jgi:hypothetical protein